MNLSEAAVVPVAVGDGKKKHDPEKKLGKNGIPSTQTIGLCKNLSLNKS
jgi:hypothetical protein